MTTVIQRVTASGTTSGTMIDSKWQRVATNDNEIQRVTANDDG